MSDGSPEHPPPSNPELVPILGAVLYFAVVVGLWGVLSAALDRDVLEHEDAGPLLGPAMVVASSLVTWAALRFTGWRPTVLAASAAASAYAAMLVVGSIGYAIARDSAVWLLLFAAHYAGSPFVIGAAVASGLIVVLWGTLVRTHN